uniref:Uncharacterized protein n=1 Tax=Ralstonia solanacearum TaxID=305 RepID=A0A0S4UED8_RALSL|nr:exported protein of unknown function [Ralstonia solanacearum]
MTTVLDVAAAMLAALFGPESLAVSHQIEHALNAVIAWARV